MQPMPTSRRWGAPQIILALIIVLAGGYWIVQTARRGSLSVDPGGATSVVRSKPADGEKSVPADAKITAKVTMGHSINAETLDPETVRLYRAADGRPVPGQILGSAADEITLRQADKASRMRQAMIASQQEDARLKNKAFDQITQPAALEVKVIPAEPGGEFGARASRVYPVPSPPGGV